MSKVEKILIKIEEVRSLMYSLIEEKEMLTDTEIVLISQELDKLLNEYDRLLHINE